MIYQIGSQEGGLFWVIKEIFQLEKCSMRFSYSYGRLLWPDIWPNLFGPVHLCYAPISP